jgi:DNA-directed RNA polymerase subunit RPC12/RpoP
MSGIRTFFRHCPSCGRRFEIRLVKKEQVDSEAITEGLKRSSPSTSIGLSSIPLSQDAPSIVDIEDFQYTYRCKHCGHEWSEVNRTESTFAAPDGYTGD